jgi:hypothetical protein
LLGECQLTIPDHIIRYLANKQFILGANKPTTWGLTANNLLVAADLLSPHIKAAETRSMKRAFEMVGEPDGPREMTEDEQRDFWEARTIGIWAMLIALAFENLLKGIIVAKQSQSSIDGTLPVSGHKLLKLAMQAELNLSQSDKDLLIALTEYSVWKGRYNTPLHANGLYEIEKIRNEKWGLFSVFNDIEIASNALKGLREHLVAEFEAARKVRASI